MEQLRIVVNPQTHVLYPGDDAETIYLQGLSQSCIQCLLFGKADCSECYHHNHKTN